MSAHGTTGGYTSGCRCVACTGAWADYVQRRKLKRRAYVEANGLPAAVSHGYSAYVNWGCRCSICTAANANQSTKERATR